MIDMLLQQREQSGDLIRVALVGAGVTARMIALQLGSPIKGMRLVAIANRTVSRAREAFSFAGIESVPVVDSRTELERRVAECLPSAVQDARLVCEAAGIDVVVEVTGSVEFGAEVAIAAIGNKKHMVLVNAELDSTLGPILKFKADQSGVVFTNTDGDEPGVAMTLLRYLRSLGLQTVAAGNLKGMIDPYRTPATQAEFAARYNQNAAKVTSFADGTKLSMEAAIIANATGFRVGRRGMFGPRCAHVREIAGGLPADQLLEHGLVDFALGAEPHTGAFVIVHEAHPRKQRELSYYKMGNGPFYVFYTPYHLPHIQIASTIARAVLLRDPTVTPVGGPVCEVATIAKRDLSAGEVIDGIGGYMACGSIENAGKFTGDRLLPVGVAEGCRLLKAVPKDSPITYDDVERPLGRLCDKLRMEQAAMFGGFAPHD